MLHLSTRSASAQDGATGGPQMAPLSMEDFFHLEAHVEEIMQDKKWVPAI